MKQTRTIPLFLIAGSRRQRGLSLVELMISITIGLILLLAIGSLTLQQSQTRDELEKNSRQIENGRYAVQLLHDDIEHAGFYGTYFPVVVTYAATDPCTQWNMGWNSANPLQIAMPISGYPAAAAAPLGCLDHYQPNTSVLVIRRTETTPVAVTAAAAGTTYFQSSSCAAELTPFVLGTGGFNLHQKDCATSPPGTPAPLFRYLVRIYYVSSCDVCGSDNVPTLKMIENGGAPVPLVEGIENMQLDYGLDTDPSPFGDGFPDIYCTNPDVGASCTPVNPSPLPAPANWTNVMAVRVNVLARNVECSVGQVDQKTYVLGLAGAVAVPPSDCTNGGYRRHVFSELVRAINPSGRRAQQ